MEKCLVSLFDKSGVWSKPYEKNGWLVIRQDLARGQDFYEYTYPTLLKEYQDGSYMNGLMAAIPCDDFALSGARWWKDKETQPAPMEYKFLEFVNRVEYFTLMVHLVLHIMDLFKPDFWVIENPVGRLHKLVPEVGKPKMYFDPCDFGDPYTKKTALYGEFNTDLIKRPVRPRKENYIRDMSGKNNAQRKARRSVTPKGFSQAFYDANH